MAIDERSYGPDHPAVAIDLNNLAVLLRATNRLAEAEPLWRRAVRIVTEFQRETGHEHPNYRVFLANYQVALTEMGTTPEQIEQRLRELAEGLDPGGT